MEGYYCGNGTYKLTGDKKKIINDIIKLTYESLPENLRTPNMMRHIIEQAGKEMDNSIITISFQ